VSEQHIGNRGAWRALLGGDAVRHNPLAFLAQSANSVGGVVQETPPDRCDGYTLGRDELIVPDVDYDRALATARRRVPEECRIVAIRASAIQSTSADR
jgi:hypothetical protein